MKIYRLMYSFSILFLFFTIKCGTKSEKITMKWENVKRINQYRIYHQFLQKNPDSVHRKECQQAMDTLKQKRNPQMQDVHSLSIIFEEDFPEGFNFSKGRDHITRQIKRLLTNTDIKYISNKKPEADISLKIKITGDPIGRRYRSMSRSSTTSIHYPGAKIEGQMTLIKNEEEIPCGKFNGKRPVGDDYIWSSEYSQKRNAPFMEAFLRSDFPAQSYIVLGILFHLPPFTTSMMDPPFMYGEVTENIRPYLGGEEKSIFIATGREIKYYEIGTGYKWRYKTDSDIKSSPIFVKDNIIIQTSEQIIVLNKENGRSQKSFGVWKGINLFKSLKRFDLKKNDIIPIQANTEILAAVMADRLLYIFDAETGKLNGRYRMTPEDDRYTPLKFQPTCQPFLVDESTVYLGSWYQPSESYLYVVDGKTGILKWKFKTDDYIMTRPVVKDNTIYFGSDDKFFYALGKDNGKLKWKYKTGGRITSNPVVDDNKVYVTSSDNYLYAFNRSTGSLQWKVKTQKQVRLHPVVEKDRIFICSSAHAYAINSENGSLDWKFTIPGKQTFTLDLVIAKNTLYTGDRYVYALDTQSGILKWSFRPNIEPAELNQSVLYLNKIPGLCVTSEFGGAYVLYD